MKYFNIRTPYAPIEAAYNIGRFFDHVGMHSRSVAYYEKASCLSAKTAGEVVCHYYVNHNLALSYLRSGNIKLASNYIKKNVF